MAKASPLSPVGDSTKVTHFYSIAQHQITHPGVRVCVCNETARKKSSIEGGICAAGLADAAETCSAMQYSSARGPNCRDLSLQWRGSICYTGEAVESSFRLPMGSCG